MFEESVPEPRKGDQLFKPGDDWQRNAVVHKSDTGWGTYAQGYKDAADFLAEHADDVELVNDFVVFPIVFLYRQYIELRLKEIIRYGSCLLGSHQEPTKGHRLDQLWQKCRKIIQQASPEDQADHLDAVEERIREFMQVDPNSTGFRYPTDANGNPSLPASRNINLKNLKEVMERIGALLDGASDLISIALDLKHEMEEEYRHYSDEFGPT